MFTTGYITGHNTNVKSVKIGLHNHLRCFVRRMAVKMMVMMMVRMMWGIDDEEGGSPNINMCQSRQDRTYYLGYFMSQR